MDFKIKWPWAKKKASKGVELPAKLKLCYDKQAELQEKRQKHAEQRSKYRHAEKHDLAMKEQIAEQEIIKQQEKSNKETLILEKKFNKNL